MNFKSITSADAYKRLISNQNSVLIDVRTHMEWSMVGIPILKERVIFSSWPLNREAHLMQSFIDDLEKQITAKKTCFKKAAAPLELFFICKAGGRSAAAAALVTNLGYNCYNIIDGFQGFGLGPGWKNNNLPWQMI